jgi:predicted ATPase/DNA-binding SARP family transcriptional activator
VSNLRKTLGSGLLVTQGRGYCLRTEPGQTDVDRFEALEAEGRRARERGDALTAGAVLREALGVWRGPAPSDFAYEPFAQAEIARLEEYRLAALENRIDADLASGEHARLVGELEGLVREHPLRERLRAQLMVALYRCDRQADALAAYGRAREVLSEQLGLEPGVPLKELQLAILNHDASLDTPRPAAGNALAARSAREPEVAAAMRGRLPVRGPRVLGRERELRNLQALLTDSSVALLTLTGAGGSGKTTLALEAARRADASFSDGVTVVWLAGLSDASQVVFELARALGVEVSSHEPAIDTLIQVLRFQERLLVLDNFEHVIGAAPLLTRLADGCSGLKLLVTSRAPLHVNVEQVYRVDGLAALEPGEGGGSLDSLRQWPASALFIERARTANPGHELREGDAAAVAELCAYLGGLPLALELAAASAALLSSGEILESVHSSRLGLGLPRRDAPDRHQTIRATIDWSLNLLGAGEQRLFGRLGAFVGGFTIEAAEAVCEDLGPSVVEGLATLLDHGLIYRQPSRPISRLWMLEPIRDYARERLNTDPERERAIRTHTEYYATLAEAAHAELTSGDQLTCLERLDDEQANIRAALDRASAQCEIDTALRIAHALGDYFFIRGLVAERRPWLAWALDQPGGDSAIRARALLDLGWLANEDGEYEQAASALAESLALCEQIRDVALTAQCEVHIAVNEWYRGRGDSAAVFAERALATAARAGDPNTEAIVLLLAAHCARSYEDARAKSQRALEILNSLGDRIWPPRIKANLAKQARRAGDHEDARLLIDEVMADPASVWGAGFRAQTERELGLIELSEGHHAIAREHLSASLALDRSIGDRRDTQDVLIGLAALELAEGAPDAARTLLAAALAVLDGPVDVRASLQGCRLTERRLSEMASITAHATSLLPLTPAQLETILRTASDDRPAPAVEPTRTL